MATRTIYLVRHGQEDRANRPDQLQGGLTKLGIEQARRTADRLRSIAFTTAYVSTMRRADQTASYIVENHPNMPVIRTQELWECVPSKPDFLEDRFANVTRAQIAQMQFRIETAFHRYFVPSYTKEEIDLFVCHGNLIRYFIAQLLNASPDSWANMDLNNCGISVVEIRDNGRRLLYSHNDTAHLPKNLKTHL